MKGRHILIIEDDEDILEVLKDILESEGYQVSTSENGQKGLNVLHQCTLLPDLILLDLMMPIMDGYQFLEQQRFHARFKDIPLIVMSADGNLDAKKKRIGVEVLMKKPLDLNILLSVVSEILID